MKQKAKVKVLTFFEDLVEDQKSLYRNWRKYRKHVPIGVSIIVVVIFVLSYHDRTTIDSAMGIMINVVIFGALIIVASLYAAKKEPLEMKIPNVKKKFGTLFVPRVETGTFFSKGFLGKTEDFTLRGVEGFSFPVIGEKKTLRSVGENPQIKYYHDESFTRSHSFSTMGDFIIEDVGIITNHKTGKRMDIEKITHLYPDKNGETKKEDLFFAEKGTDLVRVVNLFKKFTEMPNYPHFLERGDSKIEWITGIIFALGVSVGFTLFSQEIVDGKQLIFIGLTLLNVCGTIFFGHRKPLLKN